MEIIKPISLEVEAQLFNFFALFLRFQYFRLFYQIKTKNLVPFFIIFQIVRHKKKTAKHRLNSILNLPYICRMSIIFEIGIQSPPLRQINLFPVAQIVV